MTHENLVLQAAVLEEQHVQAVVSMTAPAAIERLGPGAARLSRARRNPALAAFCDSAEIDCGYVPESARLADFGLVAMDMDSTLITIECVDELADLVGLKARVAAITAQAMRGEIDFRASLEQRVALLAGEDEAALQRVYDERLGLSPGAERLLARLRETGAKTLLVSGGFTFFTERLKARLGLDYMRANVLEIHDGRLTGRLAGEVVDASVKAAEVRRVRATLGLARAQVLVLGDGANDLAMMAEAGVSIAYRAKPVVREKATYSLSWAGLDGVLALFP